MSEFPNDGKAFPGMEFLTETDLGRNERAFSPDDRYRYSLLTAADGERYFSKSLPGIYPQNDAKWSKYLAREASWADFAGQVAHNNPELGLESLKAVYIERAGDGSVRRLVYPFIDAPFVSEPGDSGRLHDHQLMDRYTDILLAFDKHGNGWAPESAIDNSDEHTPYDHLDSRWGEWVKHGNLIKDDVMTQRMLDDARSLVTEYGDTVRPRMQHGDFVPWHLFDDKATGKWITFDGEHASLLKPRFYDVAYSYTRVFTRSKDAQAAQSLLRQFAEKGVRDNQFTFDELESGIIPVLTSRTIGMFLDAQHDKQSIDYFDEANELYRRCMMRDLRAFLG